MKDVLKMVVCFVLAIAVATLGGYAWKYFMAPVAGKAEAEWQIESGPNRTAQYDKFFDQCAAIQGYESTIKTHQEALKFLSDPSEVQRTKTVIVGVKAARSRAIAQYNADARKSYTQGRFLDGSLPKQLSDSSEVTLCVN